MASSKIICEQNSFSTAREVLERGKAIIEDSHMIEGELVRVKYLEGFYDDNDNKKPSLHQKKMYPFLLHMFVLPHHML